MKDPTKKLTNKRQSHTRDILNLNIWNRKATPKKMPLKYPGPLNRDLKPQPPEPLPQKQLSPEERAQELFEIARRDIDTYDIFRDLIKSHELIAGKTIEEWEEYFRIKVPESPDSEICKRKDMELMALVHECSFLLALAQRCVLSVTTSSEVKFREAFAKLVEEHTRDGSRIPATATLDNLARAGQEDIERIRETAKRDLEFWKRIMANLDQQRKLINDATINNGIQAKLDAQHRGNIQTTPER